MNHTKLVIEYVSIDGLKANPDNARFHSENQIAQLARSIGTFGLNAPLLVDAQMRLVCGHARLAACRRLGLHEVPIVRLEHLTADQIRAFSIADNRLCEIASWDDRVLGEQLKILSEAEIDFDLEITGFDMGEIDIFIENLSMGTEQEPDPADVLPKSSSIPVTRIDDLWLLGKHRVLCGNALFESGYEVLLQGQKADMVFTDPPYNLPIVGHVSGNGKVCHREFVMGSGEFSEHEFIQFLTDVFHLLVRHSQTPNAHYVFMDWRHMGELLTAGRAAYSELKNLCIWTKDNAGMGSFYRSQHELVFVFQNGKGTSRNNIQLGRFGRSRSNVWRYPGANSFARTSEEGNLLALHPTVKPVALVADAIQDCTARGDIILDPFLGSGTTVIAAERIGRACYGMELDPVYVDTSVRRWQRFTGQSGMHLKTGQTFHQREQEIVNDGRV